MHMGEWWNPERRALRAQLSRVTGQTRWRSLCRGARGAFSPSPPPPRTGCSCLARAIHTTTTAAIQRSSKLHHLRKCTRANWKRDSVHEIPPRAVFNWRLLPFSVENSFSSKNTYENVKVTEKTFVLLFFLTKTCIFEFVFLANRLFSGLMAGTPDQRNFYFSTRLTCFRVAWGLPFRLSIFRDNFTIMNIPNGCVICFDDATRAIFGKATWPDPRPISLFPVLIYFQANARYIQGLVRVTVATEKKKNTPINCQGRYKLSHAFRVHNPRGSPFSHICVIKLLQRRALGRYKNLE